MARKRDENDPLLDEKILNVRSDDLREIKNALKEEEKKKPLLRRYRTKHRKLYPELYKSDVSIHPSYTDLKILPYHVVCRQRAQRIMKQIHRQLNREIMHFARIQMFALDGVKVDRNFSVGISPKMMITPDLMTEKERRSLNELLRDL